MYFCLILSGEVRNDLYVTLKCADLDRGNKKSQKNVEVKVTVLNEAGKLIPVRSLEIHFQRHYLVCFWVLVVVLSIVL